MTTRFGIKKTRLKSAREQKREIYALPGINSKIFKNITVRGNEVPQFQNKNTTSLLNISHTVTFLYSRYLFNVVKFDTSEHHLGIPSVSDSIIRAR